MSAGVFPLDETFSRQRHFISELLAQTLSQGDAVFTAADAQIETDGQGRLSQPSPTKPKQVRAPSRTHTSEDAHKHYTQHSDKRPLITQQMDARPITDQPPFTNWPIMGSQRGVEACIGPRQRGRGGLYDCVCVCMRERAQGLREVLPCCAA